jgi:hypothetical protein
VKTFLVATKNKDKYKIAKALLEKIFPGRFSFASLIDIGITEEIDELGSIEDRARQKPEFYRNCADKQFPQKEISAVVGIDDGFGITEADEGDPNSKELTDQILSGSYLAEGKTIWLKRAFAISNDNGTRSIMTSIPFAFRGYAKNIKNNSFIFDTNFF